MHDLAMGQHSQAMKIVERGLVIQRAALGGDDTTVGLAWYRVGDCRARLRDCAGALKPLDKCLAIARAADGDDHANVGMAWHRIGQCGLAMGDYAVALDPMLTADRVLAQLGG